MDIKETVLVGEILKPQGINGELKIYPITDDAGRFKNLQSVFLAKGEVVTQYKVLKSRIDPKGMVFLELEGLETREQSERLRGFEVRITRDKVPPLAEGWYYFELEGMRVYENNILLGTLTQVLETGSNDVYLIKGAKGEFYIPALKSVVQKVDVPAGRMDVILPEGLLD
ncbi:16S rRNA processing protein RimM [Syntrophobotulus glycolicus DSM 8271]|uniref:Ribosome maturation factor RimM n=1 Tax=Syntrophobotulus glycolicus (strain DSM 8271 / FlGlyR) TaxID=645991 RepID=F0SUE1_SYNGF|nr:16S rRNA processing protein RimM [Syntrophobotulus glycolicus DSM 8271]